MSHGTRVTIGALMVAALGLLIAGILLTRPASPPDGATRLALRTWDSGLDLPFLPRGCPAALGPDVRFTSEGGEAQFVSVERGNVLPIAFPAGFGAWIEDGTAMLVAPGGMVVAREGDVLSGYGGGWSENDELFSVCLGSPVDWDSIVQSAP